MNKSAYHIFLISGIVLFLSLSSYELIHKLEHGTFLWLSLIDLPFFFTTHPTPWEEINHVYAWALKQWVGWLILMGTVLLCVIASVFSNDEQSYWT